MPKFRSCHHEDHHTISFARFLGITLYSFNKKFIVPPSCFGGAGTMKTSRCPFLGTVSSYDIPKDRNIWEKPSILILYIHHNWIATYIRLLN